MYCIKSFPSGSDGRESTGSAGDLGFRKIPWGREWQPCPVFLPGEFHGKRILAGCSPWNHKDLDTIE